LTFKLYLVLSVLSVLFFSCSNNVIKRNTNGKMARKAPRQFFSGVRKKIVLLKFFNEAPYGGQGLSSTATEELRYELSRSGQFIMDPIVGRNFPSSKEVYSGGGLKLVQLARKAKITGVNFVIFGRIKQARIREKTDEIGLVRETKSYTESKVEIRIFDVNANREIFTNTVNGFADDSTYRLFKTDREEHLSYRQELLRYGVRVAIRRAIPKIAELSKKLDWIGKVAKIIGNKIYINAGRASGIQIGDILKVITEGEEIYDPESGGLIGKSKGEVKGAIEVIDYFDRDGAIAILHSGGSVQEGDNVQLY